MIIPPISFLPPALIVSESPPTPVPEPTIKLSKPLLMRNPNGLKARIENMNTHRTSLVLSSRPPDRPALVRTGLGGADMSMSSSRGESGQESGPE